MNAQRLAPLFLTVSLFACGGDGPSDTTPDSVSDTALPDATGPEDSAGPEDTTAPADTTLPDVSTPDLEVPPQPIAGACRGDSDCASGYCNTWPVNGYCSLRCTSSDDCPEDTTCIQDFDSDGQRRRLCLKSCESNQDCRTDQFCPAEVKLCAARCQEGRCPNDQVCNQSSGRCEPPPPCEPTPELCDGLDQDCNGYIDEGCGPPIARPDHVIVHDLGRVVLGGSGVSRTFSFVPRSGSSSFSIIAVGIDHPETYLTLYSLRSPSGVDLMGDGNPYEAPNRSSPSYSAYTAMVPTTDTLEVESGRYTFNFYAFPEDDLPAPQGDAWIYIVENTRTAEASAIDINFWFVGLTTLNASGAPNSNKFQKLVTKFGEMLAGMGIALGKVAYYDVPEADAQRLSIIDTGEMGIDEHGELLTFSRSLPATDTGVNIFLVRGFSGWGLLGRAGGIPGPPGMHGTHTSGVVVSMGEYFGYPNENTAISLTAQTIAHELGHQLGLSHTTEANGQMFDPISDTPECPATFDRNGDGYVDPDECSGRGANNVMFWTSSFADQVSAGQRKILHKNPSLRDR